jgi:hypothetical protein
MANPSRKTDLKTRMAKPPRKPTPQNRHPKNVFTAPSTNIKTNSHRVN